MYTAQSSRRATYAICYHTISQKPFGHINLIGYIPPPSQSTTYVTITYIIMMADAVLQIQLHNSIIWLPL